MFSNRLFVFLLILIPPWSCHPLDSSPTLTDNGNEGLSSRPFEPGTRSKEEVEKFLIDTLVEWYYNTQIHPLTRHHRSHHHHHNHHHQRTETNIESGLKSFEASTVDHEMQRDQPFADNNDPMNGMQADAHEGTPSYVQADLTIENEENIVNENQDDRVMRERRRDTEEDIRAKDLRLNDIVQQIQRHTGRDNSTRNMTPETQLVQMILKSYINSTTIASANGSILGKIFSSYPSCDLPKNTDLEKWRDENVMNLYFPNEPLKEENISIATATLKLFRIFNVNDTSKHSSNDVGCETTDEDRLLRVSVFWYTKPLNKKNRLKRRLCDSKVIRESSQWVELNIWHAMKAWSKGKNLGLAIVVEDQDQIVLKPNKYFKGVSCTVGASAQRFAAGVAFSTEPQHVGRGGRNHTAPTVRDGVPLSPIIEYCLLELPENNTHDTPNEQYRVQTCSLKLMDAPKLKDQNLEDAERLLAFLETLNRFQSKPSPSATRNIPDIRDQIQDKRVILTSSLLKQWTGGSLNISSLSHR